MFDISKEPVEVQARYGPTQFGHQCLIARRLIEAGVPFVKVARAWWDSHGQNFETHQELCADLDHSMSVLLDDLEQRGLLKNTLVITLGEFGRTPQINASLGRDHFASAWSCSLSGMGIRGGVADPARPIQKATKLSKAKRLPQICLQPCWRRWELITRMSTWLGRVRCRWPISARSRLRKC